MVFLENPGGLDYCAQTGIKTKEEKKINEATKE